MRIPCSNWAWFQDPGAPTSVESLYTDGLLIVGIRDYPCHAQTGMLQCCRFEQGCKHNAVDGGNISCFVMPQEKQE